MHPSVFTELLINLLTFLPFHWNLKLTSIRAIKNGVQRRHYVIFVGFGYKKSLGSSFFGAWADFHWNCERSFVYWTQWIQFYNKLGMWVVGDTTTTHVVCHHRMRIFNAPFAYLFWLADYKKSHVVCRHQMRIFNTSFAYLFWLANNNNKKNPKQNKTKKQISRILYGLHWWNLVCG